MQYIMGPDTELSGSSLNPAVSFHRMIGVFSYNTRHTWYYGVFTMSQAWRVFFVSFYQLLPVCECSVFGVRVHISILASL